MRVVNHTLLLIWSRHRPTVYPSIGQQESLFPFRVEERNPISRTLTDSAGGTITPAARGLAPAQGAGENERHSSPCVPFSWDDTAPAARAARIQVSAKGIVQRQLCRGAASSGVQFQIPGSPVVVAATSSEVMEFDTSPGVASSPPQEPGVVATCLATLQVAADL